MDFVFIVFFVKALHSSEIEVSEKVSKEGREGANREIEKERMERTAGEK